MENVGVKSKKRVKELGEVYTPDSIVQDMIQTTFGNVRDKGMSDEDIIKATNLEPTCGDGQFLVRLYDTKLRILHNLNKYTDEENTRLLIRLVSTIYGIDIDKENIEESKIRILQYLINGQVWTFDNDDTKFKMIENPLFKKSWYQKVINSPLRNAIINIVNNNIIVGDMLDTFGTNIVAYDWSEDNKEVQVYTVMLEALKYGDTSSDVTHVRYTDIEVVLDTLKDDDYVSLERYNDLTDKYEDMYKELQIKKIQAATTKSKPSKKSQTFSMGAFK